MNSRQLSRLVMVVLLTIALTMGGVVSAFAAGDPIYGTEAEPAQAAATKALRMPEGTVTPTASFTFKIEKKSFNGDDTAAGLALMPAITDKTVSFTSADTGVIEGDNKVVRKETASIFAGVTFAQAGLYIYSVSETSGTYTIADATKESMTYSPGKYDLAVYVKDGVAGRYIYAIAAIITVIDQPGDEGGDKVDPRPGGDPLVSGDYSHMVFTNTYIKKSGGTDPTLDEILGIYKAVAGDFANRELYFPIAVTATKPALVTGAFSYKVYVLDVATNTVVTSAANGTGMLTDTFGGYFLLDSGTAKTINLKHGQKLVFVDMHMGTKYVAVEAAVPDYTASVAIIVDGGTAINIANTDPNTALSTQTRIIGENTNRASFTNTYKTVTPTGLDISNLPFIVLLIVSMGGFAGLVVGKNRRRDDLV